MLSLCAASLSSQETNNLVVWDCRAFGESGAFFLQPFRCGTSRRCTEWWLVSPPDPLPSTFCPRVMCECLHLTCESRTNIQAFTECAAFLEQGENMNIFTPLGFILIDFSIDVMKKHCFLLYALSFAWFDLVCYSFSRVGYFIWHVCVLYPRLSNNKSCDHWHEQKIQCEIKYTIIINKNSLGNALF